MADYVIALPFRFDASTGKLATTSDQKIVWKDRVRLVLLTRFGERVMNPSFGSDVLKSVFETESYAMEILSQTIGASFNQWLPSLQLISITPKYDSSTGSMSLSILYRLPSGEQDVVTVKSAVFDQSGDIIQEISHGQ